MGLHGNTRRSSPAAASRSEVEPPRHHRVQGPGAFRHGPPLSHGAFRANSFPDLTAVPEINQGQAQRADYTLWRAIGQGLLPRPTLRGVAKRGALAGVEEVSWYIGRRVSVPSDAKLAWWERGRKGILRPLQRFGFLLLTGQSPR